MTINIPLTNRLDKHVIIDKHVYDALAANEYLTSVKFLDSLREHSGGYAVYQRYIATKKGPVYETIYLHKFIAEKFIEQPPSDRKLFARFIDGNPLNATLQNLEWVTLSELRRNMKGASKTTGYRGVTVDRGRFRAAVYVGKTRHELGFFDTAEAAALAYNRKSRELFGETPSLNVVLDADGNEMEQ